MAQSALSKKLKLKPGMRAAVLRAPEGYLAELGPLPEGVTVGTALRGTFDWMQVFCRSKAEVDELAPRAARALEPGGVLWLSFPKGTSKGQTDLTRDKGWDVLRSLNLKWLVLVSVNETWSAFALRPLRAGETKRER